MSIAAALIGGAFNLFGGKKNRDAQRDANAANSPEGQVAAWEAAGINPVMGITQGQWIPQQALSMGDSFANAGNALARGMELNHQEQLAQTGLRKENEELREALSELSKRPEPSNMERFGSQLPIGGHAVSSEGVRLRSEVPRLDALDRLYYGDDLDRLRSRDLQFGEYRLWDVDETLPPAQNLSDEYGDLVEWVVGAGKFGADMFQNVSAMPGIRARTLAYSQRPTGTEEAARSAASARVQRNILEAGAPVPDGVWLDHMRSILNAPLPFHDLP